MVCRKQSAGEGLPSRAESGTDSRAERSRAEGVYTDMSEKVLRVQMFGGFAMYYGDEAVTLNKAGSSKSVRLLQMLLLSLPGGIAKNELIDNLYGWNEKGDVANRNKNLNNLIYRLKGQLVSGGLPDDEYVELNDGMCFFKSRIPLELDTQKFEETVELAKIAWGGVKRDQLLSAANEMYRGELLPSNFSDMWFYQKSNHYKELYIWTVRELESEYIKRHDYKGRIMLYTRAAAIYPFDNWQVQLIRCNLEVYRYEEALEIYNNTMELYAKEMGSPPTAEMQECFENIQLMDDNHRKIAGGASSWRSMDKVFLGRKNDIKSAIFGEEGVKGAYYCTYPSFVDYCRMVARAKERSRFNAVLMFLTLSQRERGENQNQKQIDLPKQMQLLKEVLGESLRIGDAYTRYGNRHFILMLVKTNVDDCGAIFQRLETAYTKRSGKGELWYYADMTQELKMDLQ